VSVCNIRLDTDAQLQRRIDELAYSLSVDAAYFEQLLEERDRRGLEHAYGLTDFAEVWLEHAPPEQRA
jgi:hypothetical protein